MQGVCENTEIQSLGPRCMNVEYPQFSLTPLWVPNDRDNQTEDD